MTAVLVLLALVATACSEPDPQARLEDAFGRTFDDSFAYQLTVEADEEALQGLGANSAQAAAVLQSLAVAGRRAGDALELRVGFGGFDLLQVRSLQEEELYLKMALDQLGAFLGGGQGLDPDATVVPPLQQAGVSQEVIEAVRAAFNGQWVGIQGAIDSQQLQDQLGATPTETSTAQDEAVREALCEDLEGFAECYLAVQDVTEEDGRTMFEVRLELRELARALAEAAPTGDQVEDLDADLADLPEQVPATVIVEDGVVTRLTLDVAEAMRSGGTETQGSIDVRLELSEHGEVDAIEAPDGAVNITGGQLADAMASLTELMDIAGRPGWAPPPSPVPTPAPNG